MTTSAFEFAVDEPQLAALASRLAPGAKDGGVIHLRGELGAGKTTFARALLSTLGVGARIKSPTYSLIETYAAAGLTIHHLDLYRIAAAEELEYLGFDELTGAKTLILIEWPERGGSVLASADIEIELQHADASRSLRARGCTSRGKAWLRSGWG